MEKKSEGAVRAGPPGMPPPGFHREDTRTCVICCDVPVFSSIGECNHSEVCWLCCLRIRYLMNDTRCPVCKADLPKVVLTSDYHKAFQDFKLLPSMYNRQFKVYFYEPHLMLEAKKMTSLRCWFPECKVQDEEADHEFKSMALLKRHVESEHQRVYCDLCLKHRKVFLREQKLYQRRDLDRHHKYGDAADDYSDPVGPHPACQFCRCSFYGDDELFDHLTKTHYTCHLCEADNIRYRYYNTYDTLEVHFNKAHFLCHDNECLEKKFVVFRAAVDLKAHQIQVHTDSKNMSRAQKNQLGRLDLGFSVRRNNDAGPGTGGDERREDGGGVDYSNQFANRNRHSSASVQRRGASAGGRRGGRGGSHARPSDSGVAPGLHAVNRSMESLTVTEIPTTTAPNDTNTSEKGEKKKPSAQKDATVTNGSATTSAEWRAKANENRLSENVEIHEASLSPEDMERLNRELVVALKEAFGNDSDKFGEFKRLSGAYRRGETSAGDYVEQFLCLVGEEKGRVLLPQVITLLPDVDKRRALRTALQDKTKSHGSSTAGNGRSRREKTDVVKRTPQLLFEELIQIVGSVIESQHKAVPPVISEEHKRQLSSAMSKSDVNQLLQLNWLTSFGLSMSSKSIVLAAMQAFQDTQSSVDNWRRTSRSSFTPLEGRELRLLQEYGALALSRMAQLQDPAASTTTATAATDTVNLQSENFPTLEGSRESVLSTNVFKGDWSSQKQHHQQQHQQPSQPPTTGPGEVPKWNARRSLPAAEDFPALPSAPVASQHHPPGFVARVPPSIRSHGAPFINAWGVGQHGSAAATQAAQDTNVSTKKSKKGVKLLHFG
eukprot:GILK01007557.1.p1 GENE.GILK01007557.1~~GILK01007557.1.p1  ORF type:complete len:831 (+),score=152.24 GILK01007557.1:47-2539(+)